MHRLLTRQPLIRHIALLFMWLTVSPMLFAQETPATAPPATMEPPVAAEAAVVEDTAATGEAVTTEEAPTLGSPVAASSVAATPVKPPELPLYASPAERDNTLLANALPDEVLWLETASEKVVALFKEGETRKTKGALLMLHSPESPQLWPAPLENIRRNLPVYGWQTLALALPQKYPIKVPAREPIVNIPKAAPAPVTPPKTEAAGDETAANTESPTDNNADKKSEAKPEENPEATPEEKTPEEKPEVASNENAESTANAASSAPANAADNTATVSASSEVAIPVLPREQLIAERVDAAITELNKNGKKIIVVMVDNSSAYDSLSEIYKKTNLNTSALEVANGPLHAVILVNMQDHEPLSKEQLSAIFSAEYLPIMDVFFGVDDAAQKAVRRLHRAEAMRNNVHRYQQVIVPPEQYVTIDDKQSFWLEKARGFMERYVSEKLDVIKIP